VDSVFFANPGEHEPGEFQGRRYVAVVGGLTRRKGGDLVLRVARELERIAPDLSILVLGCGEPEFDALAAECRNVRCLGFVDVATLASFLKGALAMLFLSRYEGFGVPVAEAMAAGAPVVSSNCAALPEIVGDAGLVVDAENSRGVAAAIKSLSLDGAVRADFSRRGRKRAETYRWESCIQRLLRALGEG
jgi:glycosyltransferase involved in cell wall biosynthesis